MLAYGTSELWQIEDRIHGYKGPSNTPSSFACLTLSSSSSSLPLRGYSKKEAPHFYEVSLSELVSCVSSAFELPEEILCSSSRNRRGALGRAVVAYLGRELGRYRLKDIAEHFKRDPAAISQGTRHIEEEIQKEGAISKTVQRVKEKLTRGRKKKYLIT